MTSQPINDLLTVDELELRVEGPFTVDATIGDWFDLEPDANELVGRPTRLSTEIVVHLDDKLGSPGLYENTVAVGDVEASFWISVPPAIARLD